MNTVKVRVYFEGKLVAEEEVPGPLAVYKEGAKAEKKSRGAK